MSLVPKQIHDALCRVSIHEGISSRRATKKRRVPDFRSFQALPPLLRTYLLESMRAAWNSATIFFGISNEAAQ